MEETVKRVIPCFEYVTRSYTTPDLTNLTFGNY